MIMPTRGTPIPATTVRAAERLLRTLSPSQVAERLRIGRATAYRIANGTHCPHRKPAAEERCPGCGGTVQLPCVKCRSRVRSVLPKLAEQIAGQMELPVNLVMQCLTEHA